MFYDNMKFFKSGESKDFMLGINNTMQYISHEIN